MAFQLRRSEWHGNGQFKKSVLILMVDTREWSELSSADLLVEADYLPIPSEGATLQCSLDKLRD